MKRALIWIVLTLLTLTGVGGVIGYVVALFYESDTDRLVTDYGALAAFSAVAAIAGGLSLLAIMGRLPRTVRLPNEWLSLSLFVLVIGAGFASVYYDRYLALAPLLAIIAAVALFGFMATRDLALDSRQ